jgi:hypothetical protein
VSGDRRRGVVAEFDADQGLGTIIDAVGRRYRFHCIEIADRSRDIAVGVEVGFDSVPKLGRYEAARIAP